MNLKNLAKPKFSRPVKSQSAWILGEKIAQGSFSNIYKARASQSRLKIWDYAAKEIRYEVADQSILRQMLLTEVRVSQEVRCPHLLPVLATEFSEHRARIFFPLLNGFNATQTLKKKAPLRLPEALWYARQITTALVSLHHAGWIHGDVKPDNVHLSDNGHVTLLDLGFARRISAKDETNQRIRRGTLRYVAPELLTIRGEVSVQSDLYGLGVTLYELLTTRKLFPQPDHNQVIQAQLTSKRLNWQQDIPNVPNELANLLDRLLSKEPLRRPHSAKEVEQELIQLEFLSLGRYL